MGAGDRDIMRTSRLGAMWPPAARRRWRRTSFRRLDGSIDVTPDDWTLGDPAGQPLARIYR
jgi:hypothetical protein